jgi:periplasmic protein TonB
MFTTRSIVVAAFIAAVSTHAFAVEPVVDFKANQCNVPSYDLRSINANEQGVVSVKYEVNADGKVINAKVEESSGYRALDRESLRAVKECKFRADKVETTEAKIPAKINFYWALN